jgi:predicted nucleotidyltransferase
MIGSMIERDEALLILRRHKAMLRARGIRRAAIFGSVSRGEARPGSDLDIMIEIDRPERLTVFDLVAIKRAVDVVDAAALKCGIDCTARRDALYAFEATSAMPAPRSSLRP